MKPGEVKKLNDEQVWLNEFSEFLKASEAPSSAPLNAKILSKVRGDLFPSFSRIIGKVAMIHVVCALAVLLICPQLGVGPILNVGNGLMGIFMQFGSVACALACGGLFLGLTSVLSTILLPIEELRAFYRFGLIHLSLLIAVSLAALIMISPEASDFSFIAFWIVGALGFSAMLLSFGYYLRRLPL